MKDSAPQGSNPTSPPVISPERPLEPGSCESTVLRCALKDERRNLRVMEIFGWKLERRDRANGANDWIEMRLVRPLTLPDLDRIRQIEARFGHLESLEVPAARSPTVPVCLWIAWEANALRTLLGAVQRDALDIAVLLIETFIGVIVFGGWIAWTAKRNKRRSDIVLARETLLQEAGTLTKAARLAGPATPLKPLGAYEGGR